jgi:hypothetical protein
MLVLRCTEHGPSYLTTAAYNYTTVPPGLEYISPGPVHSPTDIFVAQIPTVLIFLSFLHMHKLHPTRSLRLSKQILYQMKDI